MNGNMIKLIRNIFDNISKYKKYLINMKYKCKIENKLRGR